jgi:hypothetical protein
MCQKASKSAYLDFLEMSKDFTVVTEAINQIEQKHHSNNRNKEKIQEVIGEYHVEKLKVVKG